MQKLDVSLKPVLAFTLYPTTNLPLDSGRFSQFNLLRFKIKVFIFDFTFLSSTYGIEKSYLSNNT